MFFRFTALMRRVRRFCASDCGAGKCWRFSAAFRGVWSGWKRVRRGTTGLASSARLGMRCVGHRRAAERVHAVLKRQALAAGLKPPNHKRVYRVMKVHGLLLDRHVGGDERRHDGRIAVDERNRRWCSDGFEIGCDNGERVRVAFALDCCDREAMSFLATTGGISGDDVRDLMVAAVEHRFGRVNRLPVTIEWLSDNGSCYIAGDTRSFARDIGLEPRTTPIESPQSNGMAEAFVRTIKRDYVRISPRPDAKTVMRQLPAWIAHYNEVHPHKALGYRSPREFIAAHARP